MKKSLVINNVMNTRPERVYLVEIVKVFFVVFKYIKNKTTDMLNQYKDIYSSIKIRNYQLNVST